MDNSKIKQREDLLKSAPSLWEQRVNQQLKCDRLWTKGLTNKANACQEIVKRLRAAEDKAYSDLSDLEKEIGIK